LLISTAWPAPEGEARPDGQAASGEIARLQDIVNAARSARSLFDVKAGTTIDLAVADAPLPKVVATLARAKIVDRPSPGMKTIPLAGGGTIAIGAPELTGASIKRAQARLATEEKKLTQLVASLAATLKSMQPKAPADVVAEKKAALRNAEEKLQHIKESRRLL
jgi:valyl-tRNA synthetase